MRPQARGIWYVMAIFPSFLSNYDPETPWLTPKDLKGTLATRGERTWTASRVPTLSSDLALFYAWRVVPRPTWRSILFMRRQKGSAHAGDDCQARDQRAGPLPFMVRQSHFRHLLHNVVVAWPRAYNHLRSWRRRRRSVWSDPPTQLTGDGLEAPKMVYGGVERCPNIFASCQGPPPSAFQSCASRMQSVCSILIRMLLATRQS